MVRYGKAVCLAGRGMARIGQYRKVLPLCFTPVARDSRATPQTTRRPSLPLPLQRLHPFQRRLQPRWAVAVTAQDTARRCREREPRRRVGGGGGQQVACGGHYRNVAAVNVLI